MHSKGDIGIRSTFRRIRSWRRYSRPLKPAMGSGFDKAKVFDRFYCCPTERTVWPQPSPDFLGCTAVLRRHACCFFRALTAPGARTQPLPFSPERRRGCDRKRLRVPRCAGGEGGFVNRLCCNRRAQCYQEASGCNEHSIQFAARLPDGHSQGDPHAQPCVWMNP